MLHCAVGAGLGLEAASIVEVQQALRCGCPPHKVMFDRWVRDYCDKIITPAMIIIITAI